jgi:hypothetical protein
VARCRAKVQVGYTGRLHLATLAASASLAWSTGDAHAGPPDRVELPYKCAKTTTGLTVTPGPLRPYQIVGSRDTARVAVCRFTARTFGTLGCNSVEVHQFDVMCGRKRVPFAELAAMIAARLPPRDLRLTQGRFTCFPHPQANMPGVVRSAPSGLNLTCHWPFKAPALRVAVPSGYAPIAEIGGRLRLSGSSASASRQGIVHAPVATSPLPDLVSIEAAPVDPVPANAARPATEPSHDPSTWTAPDPTWIALLVALLMAAGVFAWRWPERAKRTKVATAGATLRLIEAVERHSAVLRNRLVMLQIPARLSLVRPVTELKAANAASAVASMLEGTQARLADLRGAGPLADVLSQEIGQLRQRLTTLTASAAESDAHAERAHPAFRNLMRDIERVRRIADSAAISIGAGRSATRIPTTRSEAYNLLGLNPDAPDGILKKVADGLRMSWHPDHARDDADRIEREARIKAINIAVELINNKRAAA